MGELDDSLRAGFSGLLCGSGSSAAGSAFDWGRRRSCATTRIFADSPRALRRLIGPLDVLSYVFGERTVSDATERLAALAIDLRQGPSRSDEPANLLELREERDSPRTPCSSAAGTNGSTCGGQGDPFTVAGDGAGASGSSDRPRHGGGNVPPPLDEASGQGSLAWPDGVGCPA